MARTHGRIYAETWRSDDDWRALPADAQWLYGLLISQADLSAAGVLPLAERRWAKCCADMTPARITAALAALTDRGFVVVDEDTEELLIRSFARRETQWANSKRVAALESALGAVHSRTLVLALATELRRVDGLPDRLAERLADRLPEPSAVPENAQTRRLPSRSTNRTTDETGDGRRETGDVPPTAGAILAPRPRSDQPTAQTLIREHIDACRSRPPQNVVGQLAKQVAGMLAEGIPPDHVRAGLTRFRAKPMHPSTLPSLVNEAMNAPPVKVGASNRLADYPDDYPEEWRYQ